MTFRVTGVRPTIVALSAEVDAMVERGAAGLLAAGKIVQARARANLAPYRYTGRVSSAVTVWVAVKSPSFVEVKVGIRGNTFAPEGATFETGWRSKRGLQPPTAPIALWALKRGIAGSPKEAQHLGFVIARAQARKGYSFGERRWLTDAYDSSRFEMASVVERYMLSSFASQARVPAGQPGAGRFLS